MAEKAHSVWDHRPLPYVVRVRMMPGEDSAPVAREWRGFAYSILEAVMAATLVVTGSTGAEMEKVTVESVAPDVAAYQFLCEAARLETAVRLAEETAAQAREAGHE